MITQEILDYIVQQLNYGRNHHFIRQSLLQSKWPAKDIDEAFIRIHFNQSQIPINHLLSPEILINNSWLIYKKKWRTMAKIIIFYTLLYLPIGLLGLTLSFWTLFLKSPSSSTAFSFTNIFGFILLFIFFVISLLIIESCKAISLTLFLASPEEKIEVKSLFKLSLSKFIQYLWLTLIQTAIFLSGILFFFIPGIIFFFWFFFSQYIFILEDIKATNALFISREIVKARFWSIAKRIIIISVMAYTFSFALKLIPNTINTFSDPWSLSPKILIIILQLILLIIDSLIIFPFVSIYHILLYKNVKQVYGKPYPQPDKKAKILLLIPFIAGLIFLITIFIMIIIMAINPNKKVRNSNRSIENFRLMADKIAQTLTLPYLSFSQVVFYQEEVFKTAAKTRSVLEVKRLEVDWVLPDAPREIR